MEKNNIDILLEQLRQEYARARQVRHEQKRVAAAHCARIRDLVNELEEVYVAMLWERAKMNKQRGRFVIPKD